MNSYWRTERGQFLLWTIQIIAGSIVAPIAILRIEFAMTGGELGLWAVIVPVLFGAANLRWNRRPVPWVGVIGYGIVMFVVLVYAALIIACASYGSCL